MDRTLANLLASPEAFGFTFVTDKVSVGGQGDKAEATYTVPLVKVIDVPLFETHFPGIIVKALDGQSIRVGSQRITRDACEANPGLERKPDELKTRLANWLLGIRTGGGTRTVEVFVGPEGAKFPTAEAAAQAWKDWAGAQVMAQ